MSVPGGEWFRKDLYKGTADYYERFRPRPRARRHGNRRWPENGIFEQRLSFAYELARDTG